MTTALPPTIRTRISEAPLSIDEAVAEVTSPEVGGIAVFLGVVRDHDGGRGVAALSYSAHPSAADLLRQCAEDSAKPYQVWGVSIVHRVGDLSVGDLAVVVAVGAAHRGPALECCRTLIDRLKVEVPIWKEQRYADGDVDWVGV